MRMVDKTLIKNTVFCVHVGDTHEGYTLERIFDNEQTANEFADAFREREDFYTVLVRERSVRTDWEDWMLPPNYDSENYNSNDYDEPNYPDDGFDDEQALASAGMGMDESY